ncbi:MAG: hypothetical protein EXR77_03225 [Myxococcales bacterium]|nr:hypothetical protein [Myxococcales bacterium]
MNDTLRFVRADTTPHAPALKTRRDDPRMSHRLVTLDADPQPDRVQLVVLGVADGRGVQLQGGRAGAADGPTKFRDHFFRMPAPAEFGAGSVLNAGDLEPAGHTQETHARLTEVVAVLRERFGAARFVVIGGGGDHAYGAIAGLARAVSRTYAQGRLAAVHVDAIADVTAYDSGREEPHATTAFRRLLSDPAARLAGPSLLQWGIQRSANCQASLQFLLQHAVPTVFYEDIDGDERKAGADLCGQVRQLADNHQGLAICVDLAAFSQAMAPGVSLPQALGVAAGAVVRAVAMVGKLGIANQLGLYELNPRFDQDGATARLAARLAWSYATGKI